MQDDILAGLNPAQREAVTAVKGPVLVLAGPGSGKTRVLAHRVAYLLRVVGVHPRAVMAVTFTNKAAGEMKERVHKLLGESVPVSTGWKGLTIGTFHSICARILRAEAGPAGLNPNYVIYDDGEQLSAIKQALRDLKLDEKMYRPEALRAAISKAKNELVKPDQYAANTYYEEVVRRVYTRYQEILAANGALDFDDLLTRTTWLFQEQPEVLHRYQERYEYLLVDEFQDTNTAQYALVRLLAEKSHNLFAVGDEDQCIVAGTLILTPDGYKPVESLYAGDRVTAASGHGSVARGPIDARSSHHHAGKVVIVTTAGGRQLKATPEHCVFARFPVTSRYQHVCLMDSHRLGYRIGCTGTIRTNGVNAYPGFGERSRQERGDAISLTMFGSRSTKSGRTSRHKPHDPWHLHELSICISDLEYRQQVESVLHTKPHKQRHRAARRSHGDYDAMLAMLEDLTLAAPDARIRKQAKLTDHTYDYMPIGNLLPGILVPVLLDDGQIGEDEIASIATEPYDGMVYDLSVPNYRNYVAGGIIVHNSIYGFRGADYRNVLHFREDFPDAKVVLLEQNYRSTQAILEAANAVIAKNRHRTPKKLRTDRGQGLQIVNHEAYDEADEAAFVAGAIQRLVSTREMQLGDCAVMYRTNAQSRALEDAFVARGMPYRLVGGTRFYQRKEIKDALAYLRLVHNPADNVSLTRIINVPPRGIGDKSISTLATWSTELGVSMAGGLALVAGDMSSPVLDGDLQARLAKPPQHPFAAAAQRTLTAFYRALAKWISVKDGLTVAALLDRIAEESGYATWLRDGTEEGEDRWANLQELRSVAAHYDDFPPDLRLTAFLEEVALVSDQDELAEPEDRVTLLTVHTAKGLEFPTVFIVGLEENIFPHSRSKDDPDQMEEERRLMYVAVTRAKDRLYLVHAFRRMIYGRTEMYEPSRFLRDVRGLQSGGGGVEEWSGRGARDQRGPFGAVEERQGFAATAGGRRDRGERETLRGGAEPGRRSGNTSWAPGSYNRAQADNPPPRSDRPNQFKPGDRVDHGLFGQGIVLKSEVTADDEEVTVAFAGKGTKTLLAGFAKLKKIAG